LLESRGWEPFALADVALLGASLSEAVRSAIESADLVVAYFDEDSPSSNMAFEAGLAAGLGKPLLVIAPGEVPSDLHSLFQVRASAGNAEAIGLALDALERSIEKPVEAPPSHTLGRPLGPYADQLLEYVRTNSLDKRDFGQVVAQAIERTGAIASLAGPTDRGFDIGVWAEDLDAIAGNPLLIELKRRFSSETVRQSLLALHSVPGARAALIVFLEEPEEESRWLRWPVVGISLDRLLHEMRERSFAEVVRELRNHSVHTQTS